MRPCGWSTGIGPPGRTTRQQNQLKEGSFMIILGIILLVAGFLLKISILWTVGIILLVAGAILAILGSTGRAIGGRRHYF
jgi:uncharacterized membrane protein HdeD (DUF308 family)